MCLCKINYTLVCNFYKNKDDNIHKSEVLKSEEGQTNNNSCRVSELNNQNIKTKYRIVFQDILTILGLDHRDASILTLYFVVLEISIPKIISFE